MRKDKVKKPFYKKWWFWIIIVIVLIFVIGGMNGSKGDSNSSKSSDSSNSTSKKSSSNKITKSQYDAITLGETDGATSESIKKEFGKATSTSTTTIDGVQADQMTWNKLSNADFTGTVLVGFSNGHAISKSITGLKIDRKSKLTLDDFNKIQNGQSESDVTKELGKPNGYTETSVAGSTTKMLEYTSGIKGSLGANFNITITDGAVSGKSQTSLE
ncbi:DUF3862 domain-containing protein [Companilactobacillus mishanensis]|uniref:DUF3862 domain-containing protein n=1 Tax=Companilactobacillus mishanensis TaxID=2486008 RepID=A0A5P0ZJU9_9LACO|nr:DUF3862 domain-containing protein [Companilactobacillus mishanensis]MQS53349.1 DUF3862 domain-containing protein [Companilactobacillus mishanensis]